MTEAKKRRKLSNIKLTKEFQFKYYGWWMVISILLIFLLSSSLYLLHEEHWQSLLVQDPYKSLEYVFTRGKFVTRLVLLSFILLIFITALGIMAAHRVAGPLIALRKAFDAVSDGDLSYRIHFRKVDDLKPLEESFNHMMDSLENKK